MIDEQPRPAQAYENGFSPMPAASPEPTPLRGPRMPGRRTTTIVMPGEYGDAGMKLSIWSTYRHGLANDISSGDDDRSADALAQIILEHNGWLDEDGHAIPQLKPAPMSAREGDESFEDARRAFLAFWDAIPQELALAISTAIGLEVSKLMTSVSNRRRR